MFEWICVPNDKKKKNSGIECFFHGFICQLSHWVSHSNGFKNHVSQSIGMRSQKLIMEMFYYWRQNESTLYCLFISLWHLIFFAREKLPLLIINQVYIRGTQQTHYVCTSSKCEILETKLH